MLQHGSTLTNVSKGSGAEDESRTRDLRFTKPLLYQLSYFGLDCCRKMRCLFSLTIACLKLSSGYYSGRLPELPEVETVVRSIRDRVTGQTILGAEVSSKRVTRNDFGATKLGLTGAKILAVRRHGKQ